MSANSKRQVHQKLKCLIITVLIIVILDVYLVITTFYQALIITTVFFIFCIFSFVNNKLFYDDSGITVSNILKKQFFISWEHVVSIENTINNPMLTRGNPDRVIIIKYLSDEKTEIIKYSYTLYSGLSDFYAYYLTCKRE